jgi:DNA (cytosine-5)-methyltransferase 1
VLNSRGKVERGLSAYAHQVRVHQGNSPLALVLDIYYSFYIPMSSYYNENDPKAAAWLRELIRGGHIAQGEVDERSIEDVSPVDLRGFRQCHFFAGIGGWSYALRLAGWPDDKPVWTGSCPCQPFSAAGKGKGFADERSLWPAFFWLISQRKPQVVFGEQVASKSGLAWFNLVQTDLEESGYTSAAIDLCAAGFGAPHIRQRLYWVAHSGSERLEGERLQLQPRESQQAGSEVGGRGEVSGLGHATEPGSQGRGYAGSERTYQRTPWAASDFIECRDGKRRPVEPGIFPLVARLPNSLVRGGDQSTQIDHNNSAEARVMRLRGYGNSIVPQAAQAFIEAYSECLV